MSEAYPLIRLIAALALTTLGGSAMYASVMVLEPAVQEFKIGRGVGSLLFGMFMFGIAFGGMLMGRVADRVGILVPAMIGSLALPAGLFAAAHAGSIMELCVAFGFMCGFLGASFTFAPLLSDISHWFTRQRGLSIGIVFSGSYVAGAIWPPVLQHYIDTQGWRETFSDLSLFTICTMVPLSTLFFRKSPEVKDTVELNNNGTRQRPLNMTPRKLQSLICAAGFGCCVAMAMPQIHIVPYVMDLGHPAIRGAEMLGLMLGFGIFSRVGSGWLSDRIGGLSTLLIGSVLQVSVLIAFLFADGLTFLYVLSIAFGLSQGGIVPSYTIILRTFFPGSEAGWRISLSFLFTIVGMAFGGWIAGFLYDLTGSYTVSFINAIAFNIVNLLIAENLLRRDRLPTIPVRI
jgi:MFS family permease